MKKNGTMRVAVLLLALTLITSCFVGSTFAKYVTKTNVNDNARVAYWGFKGDSELVFNLFEAEYLDEGFNNSEDPSVKSQDGVNVVAPGTSWETEFEFKYTPYDNADDPMGSTSITAPEVAYSLEIVVEFTAADGESPVGADALDANPSFIWELDGEDVVDGDGNSTIAALKAAIEALDGSNTTAGIYKPNELPTNFQQDDTHTIGWRWEFEGEYEDADKDDDNDGITNQDEIDTAMGNAEALDNLTISITFIATQIEEGTSLN